MDSIWIVELIEADEKSTQVLFVGSSQEKALEYIQENPDADWGKGWSWMLYTHKIDSSCAAGAVSDVRYLSNCAEEFDTIQEAAEAYKEPKIPGSPR